MKKYIPMIAGAILLVIVIAAVIVLQTRTTKQVPQNFPPETQKTGNGTPSIPPVTVTVIPTVKEITLAITSPINGTTVKSSVLILKGNTVAKAEVSVNEAETLADGKGNFSAKLTLDEGENIITVVANDSEGNSAETELTVIYDSGQ